MRLATALAAALLLTACSREPQVDKAFGDQVKTYLMAHPEVVEDALIKLQETRAEEQRAKAGDHIRDNAKALFQDKRDFVANPNGKVTVVEFYDYNCGYCKLVAPQVAELIRKDPDVRFVFKEWSIFGGASDQAARAMMAARDSGKYLELHKALMAKKPVDEAALRQVMAEHGVNADAMLLEGGGAEVDRQMADVHALAGKLGIEGTPAFIVGDKLIPGADFEAVKAAIAEAKKKAK